MSKKTYTHIARWHPHKRYDHAFAIIRIDRCQHFINHPKDYISIKKVVYDEQTAQDEVERLNQLRSHPEIEYYYQITRIEKSVDSSSNDTDKDEQSSA